ncbi:hypothetical protein GJ744_009546 [Endocarpon pusillum]|uniref:VOC domain-containing protein n=1 Tax=Endocarpon pusillum TaxID=364733 RepID=A0A8H7E4C1_9EURO|nr:hypothetical protein GJ744_009546 [Endocarpon pusillum]
MLGHIRVLDLEASLQFYLTALSHLSYKEMRFLALRQYTPGDQNGYAEKPTPVYISFYAKERRLVDEFHVAGIKAGGKDNGKPGVRPWMEGYYTAYVPDLDENNIEVVHFATETDD